MAVITVTDIMLDVQALTCSFSHNLQILKEFLRFAEAEVRTLASLYSTVVSLCLMSTDSRFYNV